MSVTLRWTEEQLRAWHARRGLRVDGEGHEPAPAPAAPCAALAAPPVAAPREVVLWLPWPPSVNRYWRHPHAGKAAGRHLISESGRAYRKQVAGSVPTPKDGPLASRLQMTLILYEPDRRLRDIDNVLKAPFDALRHAGVYKDDSQIRRLFIDFADPRKPGRLHFTIKEL